MKKKLKIKSVSYDEGLIKRLKNRGYATQYLQACLEQADMPDIFLNGLRNVAQAFGITTLAKKRA